MTDTTHLGLPYLDAAQAQKHVTHNDALRMLDALVQLSVIARNVATPPASPAEGGRWLVGAGATGAFAGKTGNVAAWQDGVWRFFAPQEGWHAYVENEGMILVFDGTNWNDLALSLHALQNLTQLGIGTTADATNVLAAKLNAALFTAKATSEGGTGDLRPSLNKSSAANTVSQLYQDNYSGRAEVGLTGDDNFHFKVSPDGVTWREALLLDRYTGRVSFPQASYSGRRNRFINGGMRIWVRNVSFTIANGAAAYTADRWRVFNALGTSANVAKVASPSGFRRCCANAMQIAATSVAATKSVSIEQRMTGDTLQEIDGSPAMLSFDCMGTTSAGTLGGIVNVNANTALGNGTFSTPLLAANFAVPSAGGRITVPLNAAQTAGLKNGGTVQVTFTQNGSAGNLSVTLGSLQLEIGTVANDFEFHMLQAEIAAAAFYYQQQCASARLVATAAGQYVDVGLQWIMRATPTASFLSTGGRANIGGILLNPANNLGGRFEITAAAVGDCYALFDIWEMNAEL